MQEKQTQSRRSIDTASCNDSPLPAPAPSVGELPTSLTFFLSADERQRVLQKLKRHKGDRRASLLRALRIDIAEENASRGGKHG